jgi:hypothetical protein
MRKIKPLKRRRLNRLILESATAQCGYNAAHVFFGGTGAVGGAALLNALTLYEEMFTVAAPPPEAVPVLLATGKTDEDIKIFTRRLFRFTESRHGDGGPLTDVRHSGYLTHSGVFIALERFDLSLLEGLEGTEYLTPSERDVAVKAAVESLNRQTPGLPLFDALSKSIRDARPFSSFLQRYADSHLQDRKGRFASVLIGIPLPSLIAYHHQSLQLVAQITGQLTDSQLEELKQLFTENLNNDLATVRATLADTVIIAHTTGVGGMYDEYEDGDEVRTVVRLGFAHAAQDEYLIEKHHHAKELASLYAEAGLLTLITAAAVGIDEVRVDERIPLHQKLTRRLFDLDREIFEGAKKTQPVESKASKRQGRAAPARQYLRAYQPTTIPLAHPPRSEALTFERGVDLRPRYAIRSGENGFFSVANAEALYRTMRVASASELGAMLARVALFGDDPAMPWFTDGICHYTETDYSRQVFDFLRLPDVMLSQTGGLEAMALQDLGSSKHQGELHTLGLLILLHRLRSLDLDAMDPYVHAEHFDAKRFFFENSRSLTFEDLESWDLVQTAGALTTLVSANEWTDLLVLNPAPSRTGLFPNRDKALQALLTTVLQSVWTVPSLGTPIIYRVKATDYMRTGYFVAPLDLLMESTDSLHAWLRKNFEEHRTTISYEEFLNFTVCDRGFVDLRPHAIVSGARTPHEAAGKIFCADTEKELALCLASLPAYTSFTTSGLLAVLFRLRQLYGVLTEARVELGTASDFRWQMPRDDRGHVLVIPGACEAFRMISEGLEKTTGIERLDGQWGYVRRSPVHRSVEVLPSVRKRLQRDDSR